MSAALALAVLWSSEVRAQDAGSPTLDGTTTVLIDAREPESLQKAAADLANDFEKVFGRRPKVVHEPGQAGGTVIWIALERNVLKQIQRPSGAERLHIQVVKNPGAGSTARHAVLLTGSDVRGAIYSVYQFSQQFLGVDPLYWWTDHTPQRRTQVVLPKTLSLTEGPAFAYRGWFINDEDLLTGWKPGRTDGTGISLEMWERIFEAILRLKGNVVIPGTFIFPDEPQVRAAGERGLIVTQHHINTVGLNTHRWPDDQPMSYVSNPDVLRSAWTRAVEQYPAGTEVLWTLGFRGKHDRPFWSDDPNAPSSLEGRAELIRAAITDQMSIVRHRYPRAKFFMNAYGEASTFIDRGLLKIPENLTLIQADNNRGAFPRAPSAGQGVYYHTAMFDGMSNHYTEMIPLERIQAELGRTARAGASEMLLVNTANVRPVLMSTRAAMELAWNPQSSSTYLHRWSTEQFGARAAPRVAEYYNAYFKAPGKFGAAEDLTMGDEFYFAAARELLGSGAGEKRPWLLSAHVAHRSGMKFASTEAFARFLSNACGAADSRWTHAQQLAARPAIPADRRQFFQAAVLTPVEVHLHLNRMLKHLADLTARAEGAEKIEMLKAALAEATAAAAALRAAEYGKWKGFYNQGDWLLDTQGLLAHLRAHLDRLQGRNTDPVWRGSVEDHAYAAYYKIAAYQGKRTVAVGPANPHLDSSDGCDWPGYGRSFGQQHYSPLTQIDRRSIGRLGLAWSMDLGPQNSATQPIAVDGVLYFATGLNVVQAVEAVSGKRLWTYDPRAAEYAGPRLRLSWGTRGIAWWKGRIFTGTEDGRLIAIDAKNGKVLWSVQTLEADVRGHISGAPRVFNGKVVVGYGTNSSYKSRGYVTAYDAQTGKQLWRFHTVPGNPADAPESDAMAIAARTWGGEWWKSGGGANVWNAIAYDAETDTVFLGTGSGFPVRRRERSPPDRGDNLFVSSIVALDSKTGGYKWHYQITPGDTWDYDATMDIELADLPIGGQLRKVLMQAPKNGFYYVIDRLTGQLISAQPYTQVTWASRIDLNTGRPVENPGVRDPEGKMLSVLPHFGGHNWMPMAYSPKAGLTYIPVLEERWRSAADRTIPEVSGALVAWDPVGQKARWKVPHPTFVNGGVLATGGDLVFQGTIDGTFNAYSATTGELAWSFAAQAPLIATPISYAANGKQYVTVLTGLGMGFLTNAGLLVKDVEKYGIDPRSQARRVLTFALDGTAALPRAPRGPLAPPDDPDFKTDAKSAAAGQALFGYCANCHGASAIGSIHAPDLRRSAMPLNAEAFAAIVRDGALVPNGMPGFPELTDAQLAELRQYIRAESQKLRNRTTNH